LLPAKDWCKHPIALIAMHVNNRTPLRGAYCWLAEGNNVSKMAAIFWLLALSRLLLLSDGVEAIDQNRD
jgi:predicted MFS family arabinose efflux permease